MADTARSVRSNGSGSRFLGLFRRKRARKAIPGVLNTEMMGHAVHRECSRANRIGLPLSLITIRCSDAAGALSHQQRVQMLLDVAEMLAVRVRLTDNVGWLGQDLLGVLLPHTSPAGAWYLVDKLQYLLGAEERHAGAVEALTFEVMACPFEGDYVLGTYRQTSLFQGYCPAKIPDILRADRARPPSDGDDPTL